MISKSLIGSMLVFATLQASAHHSVSGVFDMSQRVKLTGVISKVEWINPHTYIHLEVANEDGSTKIWQLESLPTAMLRKAGITSAMIRDGGSIVTVDAVRARDGTVDLAWLQRLDTAKLAAWLVEVGALALEVDGELVLPYEARYGVDLLHKADAIRLTPALALPAPARRPRRQRK